MERVSRGAGRGQSATSCYQCLAENTHSCSTLPSVCSSACCSEAERLWEEEDDDKHNMFSMNALVDKDERMAGLVKKTMVRDGRC